MRRLLLLILIGLTLSAAACSYPYGDKNDYTLPVYEPPTDDDASPEGDDDTSSDEDHSVGADDDDDNDDNDDDQYLPPERTDLTQELKNRPLLNRP